MSEATTTDEHLSEYTTWCSNFLIKKSTWEESKVRPELSAACTLIVMHEPTCPHRDFYNPLNGSLLCWQPLRRFSKLNLKRNYRHWVWSTRNEPTTRRSMLFVRLRSSFRVRKDNAQKNYNIDHSCNRNLKEIWSKRIQMGENTTNLKTSIFR